MTADLLEGVRSITLPCTLAVLIPGALVVLAAGRRAGWSVVAFVVGVATLAWARAAGWWPTDPDGGARILVAALFTAAFVAVGRVPQTGTGAVVALPAAMTVGVVTAWLWRPCVGRELGDVLDRAPENPATTLVPMLVHVIGLCVPLLALATTPNTAAALARVRDSAITVNIGLAAGIALGLAVALGWYDDVVIALFRRSSPLT